MPERARHEVTLALVPATGTVLLTQTQLRDRRTLLVPLPTAQGLLGLPGASSPELTLHIARSALVALIGRTTRARPRAATAWSS